MEYQCNYQCHGTYTVDVPKNDDVYFDCSFATTKRVFNGGGYDSESYLYKQTSKYVNSFGTSTDDVDINVGAGVPNN
ncbi:MAG: hypothetical protein HC896_15450 [Bacteroidales bacterium]|nr:hypothetical protein [Bacteroidales bacterium]